MFLHLHHNRDLSRSIQTQKQKCEHWSIIINWIREMWNSRWLLVKLWCTSVTVSSSKCLMEWWSKRLVFLGVLLGAEVVVSLVVVVVVVVVFVISDFFSCFSDWEFLGFVWKWDLGISFTLIGKLNQKVRSQQHAHVGLNRILVFTY